MIVLLPPPHVLPLTPAAPVDSSDIDSALVAKLGADTALLSYAPNGVYFDEAPAGATKFVIVSLVDEIDEPQFGGRSYENALYLVKYVELKPATGVGNAKAAAARIDRLLDGATLTIANYTLMILHRESRLRKIEVDDLDESIRWNHRGGWYRLMASL